MDYPGAVITVNHYKYKGRYTRPEARHWSDALGWQIKGKGIEAWTLPLSVTCDGVFRNKRQQPDLSNCSKVVLDAIENATGINDRDMRWHDGDVTYGPEPKLIITIKEGKDD